MCAADRDHQSPAVDVDAVLELNFVPQWARRPPDAVRFSRYDDAGERSDRRGGPARDRDPLRKRQSRERRPDGVRPPREPSTRREAVAGSERASAPLAQPRERTEGDRAVHAPRDRAVRPAEQQQAAAPVTVQFLPERKAILELVKRIKGSKKAYPLLDLASLLLAKEGMCFVKIEVEPSAREQWAIHQCAFCQTIGLDRSWMERHIADEHIDAVFDIQTEAVEPPSGVFVCVAKCGLSGTLLGPPNHHSYTEAVKELHAARYAGMDLDQYRSRIEISHDPEDVEKWKAACSERTVYRLRADGEEAKPISAREASRYMQLEVVPDKIKSLHRVVLTEPAAHLVRDPRIRSALRQEWQRETRFPIHVALALRAAFRSRQLHLFKTGSGKGMHFVMPVQPVAIDPETTIPEIREALLYLQAHPGCTRSEMVEDLLPGLGPDDDRVKQLLQPLHWLADRGHVIEFFNGTLSVPLHRAKNSHSTSKG